MKLLPLMALSVSFALGASIGPTPQFQQARSLYYQGADGHKEAYVQADKLFSECYRQAPSDPLIQVYYGSLRLLEASHTWALWKKNSLSKQGIQLMDRAVAAAPGNLEVRFVRGATTYELPAFFHRRQQSKDDFALLAEKAVTAARNGNLEPRLAAASLYYHGVFQKQESKNQAAEAAWTKAIEIAPESRAARDSQRELRDLPQAR